ncbi:bifunctional epoxide hydrolase 2 isoform X1 [Leopardus geoffroyi]|uniref:bifunctional epoxide hydrolase 2 isoform X1 n=1 Tax=Leopardus geoffroyi TaxID=46844 RepID=UPI001E25FCEC|nr:bifunctional epoxide hydrolase 2 isoform X1 [Leopardus geoffroyi]
MALRAALFDLYGVLALPSLAGAFSRAEEELALPRGFLIEAFQKGGPDGPSARLMRGEITYSQWVPLVEENCRKCSQDSGIRLPENFSVSQIFGKAAAAKINHPMLQAALALRKQGYTTCLLTNNWLDDSAQRGILAQLVCQLRPHFDFLVESCRIRMAKPDPRIYKFVLDTLNASPNEVVFLDDMGANLEPARDLGMVTILVRDTDTALRELEKVTGVQLLQVATALPIACNPRDVSHGYVPIKPGVRMHFVELGSGPAVCLCHGFPESWFSWRYQIPALAQAGFRVLALDMKGYGESSAPPEIEEYSLEVLCKEMVTFLDKLGITQAVFIGHDWGGMLVWNMALFYPERVRAVASLNIPFIPADPSVPTMEKIKANPIFDYQLYFQEPGVAEAELEQNLSRTFKSFFRASDEAFLSVSRVREMVAPHDDHPCSPSWLYVSEVSEPRTVWSSSRGSQIQPCSHGTLPCQRTLCENPRGAQPQPHRHRGGHSVLCAAVQEVWFQGSPKLVSKCGCKLAVGLHRFGTKDPDSGSDGDRGEGCRAHSGDVQAYGGLDPLPEKGTHYGLRTLDTDGEAH